MNISRLIATHNVGLGSEPREFVGRAHGPHAHARLRWSRHAFGAWVAL